MSRKKKSSEPPRFTETWLAAVMADPAVPDRAARVAWALAALHADWNTGANCWPSTPTLARETGMPVRKVKRALPDLEALDYLVRTGITRRLNVTDYRLTLPSSATHGTTSSATHGTTDDSQSGHFGPPVVPPVVASSATGDTQPPLTRQDHRTDGRGGSADAPAPDGRDAPRPTAADIADILATNDQHLPESWAETSIDPNHDALSDALAAWTAIGWSEHLPAALATLGKPGRSPAGLIAAQLDRLRATGRPPVPPVTIQPRQQQPTGKAPAAAVHPFDGANQNDLAAFCKTIAAKPDTLRAATAKMLADGMGVYLQLGADDWQSLDIREAQPDDFGGWAVEWGFYPEGEPTLEGILTEYPDDILSELTYRLNNEHGTALVAELNPPYNNQVTIAARLCNLNQLVRLVEVTRKAGRTAARWTLEREGAAS